MEMFYEQQSRENATFWLALTRYVSFWMPSASLSIYTHCLLNRKNIKMSGQQLEFQQRLRRYALNGYCYHNSDSKKVTYTQMLHKT